MLIPRAIKKTRQNANRSIPVKKLFRNSPCSPIPNIPSPVYINRLSDKYWIGVFIMYSTAEGKYAKADKVNIWL